MTRSDEVYEFYVGEGVTGATISIEGTARIDGTMDGIIKAGHLIVGIEGKLKGDICLLYTSPSPRDLAQSRMPSSA